MTAASQHGALLGVIHAAEGNTMAAAMSEPTVFHNYFWVHLLAAQAQHGEVYPVGYGIQGGFLLGVLGMGGHGYDDATGRWHSSSWIETPNAVVFGETLDRAQMIKSAAEANGLVVVYCVRMDTNEVIS